MSMQITNKIDRGDEVNIYCILSGSPTPTITWTYIPCYNYECHDNEKEIFAVSVARCCFSNKAGTRLVKNVDRESN